MTPTWLQILLDAPALSRHGWQDLGWLQRILVASRAGTLLFTALCCLLGGLLALPWTPAEGRRVLLVSAALVLAHAAASLLLDLLGVLTGTGPGASTTRRQRLRYGPHPLAQGLVTPLGHGALLAAMLGLALVLGLGVVEERGGAALVLAGLGAAFLLLYLRPLGRLASAEAAVLIVWGPLMAGGVYWFVSGDWGPEIAAVTLLYGMGPMLLVLARHCDLLPQDAAHGRRSLALLLGAPRAQRLLALLGVLQVAGVLGWAWISGAWGYLTIVLALPALLRFVPAVLRRRPPKRPPRWPRHLWPLWCSVPAFRLARASSAALVAGALIEGVW